MNKIYKFFGGRKMFLALIILVNGIILAYSGILESEFVALVSVLGGWYAWGNIKVKQNGNGK